MYYYEQINSLNIPLTKKHGLKKRRTLRISHISKKSQLNQKENSSQNLGCLKTSTYIIQALDNFKKITI